MQQEFESVEIVTAESSQQNAADLLVIASNLELLSSTANGEIINENLRLIERPLRDARQLLPQVVEPLAQLLERGTGSGGGGR